MKSRAIRRHHNRRVKDKFIKKEKNNPFWTNDLTEMERRMRMAGHYANHGCDCSCPMCGNPRRHFGEPTVQEKRYAGKVKRF